MAYSTAITTYIAMQPTICHSFSTPMIRKMKNTTPSTTGITVVQNALFPRSSRHSRNSSPLKAGSATWVKR